MADEIRRESTSGAGGPPGGYSGSQYGGSGYGTHSGSHTGSHTGGHTGSHTGGHTSGYGGHGQSSYQGTPATYSTGGSYGPSYGSTVPGPMATAYEKPPMIKRISWGAIFAGTFVALSLTVLLWLLGAAVGLAAFDPRTPPGEAAMWGFGIWGIVVTIIALFAGGLVAAWLAGLPKWMDAMLHGVVVWSLTTTATIAFTALTGATIFAGGMAAMGDQLAMGGQQQQQMFGMQDAWLRDDPRAQVDRELRNILPTDDDWFGWNRDVQYTDRDIQAMISQIERGQTQQLAGILVRDGDMNPDMAQRRIQQWQQILQEPRALRDDRFLAAPERDMQRRQPGQAAQPTMTDREAVDTATAAVTWAFFALLLGAAAAAVGGAIGRPSYMEERITQGGYPRHTPYGYQEHGSRSHSGHTTHSGYSGGESGRYTPPPTH